MQAQKTKLNALLATNLNLDFSRVRVAFVSKFPTMEFVVQISLFFRCLGKDLAALIYDDRKMIAEVNLGIKLRPRLADNF